MVCTQREHTQKAALYVVTNKKNDAVTINTENHALGENEHTSDGIFDDNEDKGSHVS